MLSPLVDTEAVFAYDCSLERAVRFAQDGVSGVYARKQATANLLPCSFYGTQKELQPGEALTLYEVIGRVEKKAYLEQFLSEKRDGSYFEEKREEAERLPLELVNGIATKTASESFDIYCQYTYMDNVLRAGIRFRLAATSCTTRIPENMGIWSGTITIFPCCRSSFHRETETSGM